METLADSAGRLGVQLNPCQCELLTQYVALVEKWNASFNLVSRQDIGRIWARHVLDSLSVLPLVRELLPDDDRRVMDVGSGAGFPGLPLAIADPSIEWLLLDRNARKIRFLELVTAQLQLPNVTAQCVDLTGRPGEAPQVPVVVSRAVDDPVGLARRVGFALAPGGVMVLLAGANGEAEEVQAPRLPEAFSLEREVPVEIPGLAHHHRVVVIRKNKKEGPC